MLSLVAESSSAVGYDYAVAACLVKRIEDTGPSFLSLGAAGGLNRRAHWTATNGWAALLDRPRALKTGPRAAIDSRDPSPAQDGPPAPIPSRSPLTMRCGNGCLGCSRRRSGKRCMGPSGSVPSIQAHVAGGNASARTTGCEALDAGHRAPTATIEASRADASAWRPHTGAQRVATLHALGTRLACRGVIGYRVADGATHGAFARGAGRDSRLEREGRRPAASWTREPFTTSPGDAQPSPRRAQRPAGRSPARTSSTIQFCLHQRRAVTGVRPARPRVL